MKLTETLDQIEEIKLELSEAKRLTKAKRKIRKTAKKYGGEIPETSPENIEVLERMAKVIQDKAIKDIKKEAPDFFRRFLKDRKVHQQLERNAAPWVEKKVYKYIDQKQVQDAAKKAGGTKREAIQIIEDMAVLEIAKRASKAFSEGLSGFDYKEAKRAFKRGLKVYE